MKLPIPAIDLASQLQEFDVWITPSLGEITETSKFREQLSEIVRVFEILDTATQQFACQESCKPRAISSHFIDRISGKPEPEATLLLQALASVLFLVTGKSDNNAKCQLPLFLRDHAKWRTLPVIRKRGATPEFLDLPIPRELKAEKYLGIVASLGSHPEHQRRLLDQFVEFLLNTDECIAQLWSIGYSYHALKAFGKERDILTPLVVFQVRGSVAASGGHDPEELLRHRFAEWGLRAAIDFNTTDVSIAELLQIAGIKAPTSAIREKTRAYDFVLPFRVPGWQPRLFIQSQFYAGDSGSVSHKNVDQTSTSRVVIGKYVNDARFLEYVDGAGYFSSLNGDLKTLLTMPTTRTFFQVRTASVRLRRELQSIGFLTPIEIDHAVLRCNGARSRVETELSSEGYTLAEIQRAIRESLDHGLLSATKRNCLEIRSDRRDISRRHLLIDLAVRLGATPLRPDQELRGALLVPGYGPFHGVKLDVLAREAAKLAPALKADWGSPEVILGDIRWLCEQGLAMSS